MKVELIKTINEAKNVISFIFQPEKPLSWKPGQFLFYKIPHHRPDRRGIERHFTISSAPFEHNIRLTSKFLRQGGSTFKKALLGLEPGDSIEAYNIGGSFTVEKKEPSYVFIAGGIGITPYRSILLDLERADSIKDILLLYSCRDRESVVFGKLWDKMQKNNKGLSVNYIFEPQLIDKKLIEEKIRDPGKRKFYISGPINMVKAVQGSLSEVGVNEDKIVMDYFPGYD